MPEVKPLVANPIYKNTQAREAFLKALKRKKGEEANYVRTKEEIELAMEQAAEKDGFEYNKKDLKKLIKAFKKFKKNDQKSGISNHDIAAYNQVEKFAPLFKNTTVILSVIDSTNPTGYLFNERGASEDLDQWFNGAKNLDFAKLSNDEDMTENNFLEYYGVKTKIAGEEVTIKNADHYKEIKANLTGEQTKKILKKAQDKYEKLKEEYLSDQAKYKVDLGAYDEMVKNVNTSDITSILQGMDNFREYLVNEHPSREDLNIALNVFFPSMNS